MLLEMITPYLLGLILDVKYKKKWIRGLPTDGPIHTVEAVGGGYVTTSTIKFQDKRYLDEQ